jgi:catechol 2,3-dioxygenase-like lactoylglutathione lyase family enzyme
MAILTHVCVGTNDLGRSTKFYDAALGAIGVNNLGSMGAGAMLYGAESPQFVVLNPANGLPSTYANGGTIGFAAPSREAVRQFHAAGLASGGRCEGTPGLRAFAPNAYGAYLRDPDGNKICAYCYNDGE